MFKRVLFGLGFLVLSSPVASFAGTLTVDLYRSGNATIPRMDNVRDTDVEKFQKSGVDWVRAKKLGISTFSTLPADQKNWWKISKGSVYSNDLYVVNDRNDHWSWAPAKDMPLADFITLMQATHSSFTKLK
jgi:hypothetical protein